MGAEVAQAKTTGLKAFNQFMTSPNTQKYLDDVLRDKKASFVNNVVALVANNQLLQGCDGSSVMFSCLKATALDLPLDSNLGLCYVLPYRDNKNNRTVATFQIGKAGIVQLALRSGQINKINVRDVREGEIVDEDFITGDLTFKKLETDRLQAKVVGYVAYLRLNNGFEKMLYMTVEELTAHGKKFSQTFKKGCGLWVDQFDAMCEKTLLKRILSKYAPLSTEMKQAFNADQAVITERGEEYVDSDYNDIEEVQAEVVSEMFGEALKE